MDDGSWKSENRHQVEDIAVDVAVVNGHWRSHDVALPAIVAGTMSGALHLWLLRPPAVVRRSAVAAAGAFAGALLVGCFVNVRRDARAKSQPPLMVTEPSSKPWDDDEQRAAYGEDLPRGPRRARKPVGLKNVRLEDA